MTSRTTPAWTTEVGGVVYTVTPAGGNFFTVWQGAERLGAFELIAGVPLVSHADRYAGQRVSAVADTLMAAHNDARMRSVPRPTH